LIDITIIEKNPTFFSFRNGNAVLQSMRLSSAFFGKGQFIADEACYEGEEVILNWSLRKGYYQPVPIDKRGGVNDWKDFPREQRELSEAQVMNVKITIRESKGRVTLLGEVFGTPDVPVAWELSFRPGGVLAGVVKDEEIEDVYFLEKGSGSYTVGEDVVRFGGGKKLHRWSQLRGALPKQSGSSVFFTGYTPFKHQIEVS
jgi:hypothetical protein